MVGGRIAGGDADVLGGAGEGGDLDHRVEGVDRRLPEDAAIALAGAQRVLEEHHVELAARGDTGDLRIVLDAQDGLGACRRMPP